MDADSVQGPQGTAEEQMIGLIINGFVARQVVRALADQLSQGGELSDYLDQSRGAPGPAPIAALVLIRCRRADQAVQRRRR